MILALMDRMSMMLYGNAWMALAGSFLWGIASVALSPCHLSSIPLVMGFVARESRGAKTRAFVLSLVFTFGIMASMLALGALTASVGRLLGDIGSWGYRLGALVFILVGLLLFDWIHLPNFAVNQERFRAGGYPAALVLGILFGTVLGPCAFAFFMPVLGLAAAAASQRPWFAAGLVSAYTIGHGLVIVIAGYSSVWVAALLGNPSVLKYFGWLRKLAGVACFAIAFWFLTK